MCDANDVQMKNEMKIKRPKQMLVLLTIMVLTLVTATSNGLYTAGHHRKFFEPLSAPGLLLMLILTEWKGRRVLFMTLFILSLLSSLIYLSQFQYYFDYRVVCLVLHSPVQGSAIVLLYTVISEYSDPKRRFFHLVANSAIQMLFYWITLVMQFDRHFLEFLGDWMQYINVSLGVFGLWSVFVWPESPYWLASKRRFQESAKAFIEVRGTSDSEELRALSDAKPRAHCFKMFFAPLLVAFLGFVMVIPRNATLEIYESLVLDVIRTKIGTYWIFLAAKSIAAILSVLTVLIPINVPRKLLFLSCGFYFLTEYVVIDSMRCGSPLLIVFLETIVDYGPRIVTLPLLIEIIPQNYVSSVTAFVTMLYVIMEYFLTASEMMLSVYVDDVLGGFIFLVTLIIAYFVMPETKEKTLVEIEQLYVSKNEKPAQTCPGSNPVVLSSCS